jgi:hypothetical protein
MARVFRALCAPEKEREMEWTMKAELVSSLVFDKDEQS